MKDNLRSENEKYEIMRLSSIESLSILRIIEYFIPSKKNFFLCIYKMLQISEKEYEKCEVEIIDKERSRTAE